MIEELFEKVKKTFGITPQSADSRKKKLGARGEKLALKKFTSQGFRILEKNYRRPPGEIDIIARKGNLLVFCEVKTRRSNDFGGPVGAVNRTKQKKIIRTANYYVKESGMQDFKCRFDIVAILWEEGKRPEVNHIEGAFM